MKEKVKVLQLLDLDEPIGDQDVLVGTLNDIRIWAKNLWRGHPDFIGMIIDKPMTEEDFYTSLDDDTELVKFLNGLGYHINEICEVPLDDFYDGEKPSQELIDEVLFQIKVDIAEGDLTALDELLKAMPIQTLISYLPEK